MRKKDEIVVESIPGAGSEAVRRAFSAYTVDVYFIGVDWGRRVEAWGMKETCKVEEPGSVGKIRNMKIGDCK